MSTNLYFALRGSYEDRKAKLKEWTKEHLEAAILDEQYNAFISQYADITDAEYNEYTAPDKKEENVIPAGLDFRKRLPYIGWYWRHLEFSSGKLPLGNCKNYIGFMANNKWNYHERETTPEEFIVIMALIDTAIIVSQQGGELGKIMRETHTALNEVWRYLQTLTV